MIFQCISEEIVDFQNRLWINYKSISGGFFAEVHGKVSDKTHEEISQPIHTIFF